MLIVMTIFPTLHQRFRQPSPICTLLYVRHEFLEIGYIYILKMRVAETPLSLPMCDLHNLQVERG